VKNLLEFVFQTLGLFIPKVRLRWVETAAVLGWQLCGAPRSWGLSMGIDPKFMSLRDGTRVHEDHAEAFNDFDSKRRQTKVIKDLHWKRTLEYSAGARSYFIKIYKVPDWKKRVKNFILGSRAVREMEMSYGVFQRGIPQAPVVAMRDGGDETWVAIEKLSDWSQLQSTLLAMSDRRRLCTKYGRFARRLHDAGIWQYDFNPTNILVRGQDLMLIDFELMKLHEQAVPRAERMASLGKMNRVPSLSRTDRLRFLLGYLDADAAERKTWKPVARELLELYQAKIDDDLDRSERRCLDENRDYGAFESGEWRGHYLKKRDGRASGLTLDEAKGLPASESFRFEAAADAVAEWQKANRRAKEGGPTPVAVLVRKSSPDGKIAFPKA
jgi:tRNA A-37 threonylcarbamoyl transferase component Bud32